MTMINTGGCAAPFILPVFIFAVNVDRCEEFAPESTGEAVSLKCFVIIGAA